MQGDQEQTQTQGQGQGQGQGRNEFSGRARNVVQAHTVHLHESAPPAPAVPRMAPAAPTRFVVREELGRAITEALRPGARVVLAGGGGYGKTAMAGWAARGFEGAVLWAELGQQPGTERIVASLAGLTAALTGGRARTYADVHAASGAFGSAVATARGRTLLVVDDAWQADDVRPFLVGADGLTVLVTTRRPGLVDGTEIRVDAMNDHEAVALLGGGDPAPLLPLLDRVGRWPLALAMLRGLVSLDGMTVTEAVAALIGELDAAGPAALDELYDDRQVRGIARTLELSLLDLPGPDSRDRYVSLAAFPEGEVIPYWLLGRLWGLNPLRTRNEARRFVSRSLAQLPHPDGLQMHDLPRETLRRAEPERMAAVSAHLLDALRPADGWHALPEPERDVLQGLAYHLRQAGRPDELGALLRDMRFVVARLADHGPTALEADLAIHASTHPEDEHARELTVLVRQESHLLTGPGLSATDVAVTLDSRLRGRPLTMTPGPHIPLRARHPLPDRDDGTLLRSVPIRGDGGSAGFMEAHPSLPLLATAGYGPSVAIHDTRTWQVTGSIEIPGAIISAARWSPDGRWLALLGDTDRFTERPRAQDPDDVDTRTVVFALSVVDPHTGAELDVLPLPGRGLFPSTPPEFTWAPDSRSLAVIRSDREVHRWEPGSGKDPDPLPGPPDDDLGRWDTLDWHPTHGLLAHTAGEGDAEGALLHWPDPDTGRAPSVWRHPDFRGDGAGLRWRPGGATAVVTARGQWMLVFTRTRRVFTYPDNACRTRAWWSPDGTALAGLHGPSAELVSWRVPGDAEIARGAAPHRVPGGVQPGNFVAINENVVWQPDRTAIATALDRKTLKLWRPMTSRVAERPPAGHGLWRAAWRPDGRALAVQDGGGAWRTSEGGLPSAGLPARSDPPSWVPRDPQRNVGETLRELGEAREWESAHGRTVLVEYAPGERAYAVARWMEPLRVVSTDLGAHTLPLPENTWRWAALCFTPGGERVIAAGRRGEYTRLTQWSLTADAPQTSATHWVADHSAPVTPPIEHIRRITADDTHLALIANPRLIGLFDLATLRPLCWLRTNSPVHDAAFSPSGEELAVVGEAGPYLFSVSP
ncbi:hypothetical protein [Streptomyces xiamenensis]|uniref:hypothetical protein n=1 Tax=Streptomyces xiamenensis TaxID=408015 RepID=UPI0037CCCB22